MNHISNRLMAIINMVTPGKIVADIGCDHGYLAIYLAKNNISERVYACDINEGPIERARLHVEEALLGDRITLRLGNGLSVIKKGEVNCVVIAGMGGRLMADIIDAGEEVLEEVDEIVLGPQSDLGWFRHFLEERGYFIVSEEMIFEDNKFYPVLKAVKGEMNLQDEIFYRYGKILIKEENPILHQFLVYEKEYFAKLLARLSEHKDSEEASRRIEEIRKDLAINEKALLMIGSKSIE